MNTVTKDILWINYLKAICILAVYFVHSTVYYDYRFGTLNLYIVPFYVNGFYLISGYLFFKKQLSTPIINKSTKEFLNSDAKILINNILFLEGFTMIFTEHEIVRKEIALRPRKMPATTIKFIIKVKEFIEKYN